MKMINSDLKILLVEDSKTFAHYISSLLSISNYTVTTALTGKAGLQYLNKCNFNLVILDMQLPDINGLEILRNIRAKHNQNELPVIVISASNDEQIITQVLEAGANDFIQKPITEITLKLKIKNLLELQQVAEHLMVANKNLKESEALKSKMIANITDVIGIIDIDGIIRYKSSNIEKWFGWEPQDLIGTDGWQTVHPEDLSRIQSEFLKILKKENSVITVEYRYKCKDGSYKTVQLSATNLTHDNLINGVLLNYHNITERKQAEKEIKMLADALKRINDGVSITDLEDKIIYVNDSFLRIYGYCREELIGRTIDFVRSPNNPSEIVKEIKSFTLNGRWNGELLNTRKDGTEFPIFLTTSSINDTNGNPIALIGVFVDITERKRAEKTLRESEEKHRIIFENVQDVFYKTDLDGTIHEISPSIKYHTEFECNELIGTSAESLYNFPGDRKTVINLLLNNGEVRDYEVQIKTKKGNIKYGAVNARLIFDSKGVPNHIYGAIRDITERKRAEEEIMLKNEQLALANSDKDRFIQILAHDLKSPFCSLLGFSDLLLENFHKYDLQKIENFIKMINETTHQTYDLLDEILLWANAHSGKLTYKPQEFSFFEITTDLITALTNSTLRS